MVKKHLQVKSAVIAFLMLLLLQMHVQAQTITVNSLQELLPYLNDDNVDVKLAPGTYSVSDYDISQQAFSNPLFLFEGSNSTYDFTDVTINIDTYVFQQFGNVEVKEIQILGNNNVLKNLTLADIGDYKPSNRAQNITIDGKDNRIEGFHISSRGSYPYGYGDAFGKGGGAVISHNKHSVILVRGLRNHVKNCTVISRTYGHCIFMQAASYPTIEGCYIEGEVRTTDDMLAETSGPAYDVGFMTAWGYRLPAGYMMSLQEAGIRAYNAGTTYIDGVEIVRGTDNPTVLNCTTKNTRTGVTLAHATGTKYVEGCTVIGCEQGYSIGSGTVINCGADAIYGPVYKNAYESDNGYNADITILPPSDSYYNGHDAIAYVGGRNHNLTFKSDIPESDIPSNLKIMIAGDLQGLRVLNGNNESQNNHNADDIVINNLSNFPIILHSDSSNTSGQSCGTITDNGSNNTVSDCSIPQAFEPSTEVNYYINNPRWTARLGADGGDEILMLGQTASSQIAQWKFTPVPGETGYYFIDCVGTETKPRLTANETTVSVMDDNTVTTDSAKWRFDLYSDNLFHITNKNDRRLRGFDTLADIVTTGSSGTYTRFSFSEISLSTNRNTLKETVSVFPIPTSDILNIKSKEISPVLVELLNVTGKVIVSKTIKGLVNQLDVSHLLPGFYFLSIQYEGVSHIKKIIKN